MNPTPALPLLAWRVWEGYDFHVQLGTAIDKDSFACAASLNSLRLEKNLPDFHQVNQNNEDLMIFIVLIMTSLQLFNKIKGN